MRGVRKRDFLRFQFKRISEGLSTVLQSVHKLRKNCVGRLRYNVVFNTFGDEDVIFRANQVNTRAVGALASSVARSSEAMVLT